MRVNVLKSDLLEGHTILSKKKNEARPDIQKGFSQLCWSCRRSLDCSCNWGKSLMPVAGWKAVMVRTDERITYAIFECPEMIPLRLPTEAKCVCCGKIFESFGNTVCSYECGIKNDQAEQIRLKERENKEGRNKKEK